MTQSKESLRVIATNAFRDKLGDSRILFANSNPEDFEDVNLGKPAVSAIALIQVALL
jgi:hypothetical protein